MLHPPVHSPPLRIALVPFHSLSVPLSRSVSVSGQQLSLSVRWQPQGDDKYGQFGWPWELWPWPPSASCSNTSQPAIMWLEGEHGLARVTGRLAPCSTHHFTIVCSHVPTLHTHLLQQCGLKVSPLGTLAGSHTQLRSPAARRLATFNTRPYIVSSHAPMCSP